MTRTSLPFLRPYLSKSFRPIASPENTRVYCSVQRRFATTSQDGLQHSYPASTEREKRIAQLKSAKALNDYYARRSRARDCEDLSPKEFNARYGSVQGKDDTNQAIVFGRVRSFRLQSKKGKLAFVDIERGNEQLQVLISLKFLLGRGESEEQYKDFIQVLRRGDWISIKGHPERTPAGQLSIRAVEIPRMLAPSLHHVPDRVDDESTLARRPHLAQLINREKGDILRLRALIYEHFRTTFAQESFVEVETPMFDVSGGGAIARPFETVANEMSNTRLKLRIAPELNLKRLVVGGQERVYELGRVFRNEGVDSTHNPEFTMCEFYQVGATLPDLMTMTEQLITSLFEKAKSHRQSDFPSLPAPLYEVEGVSHPFHQLPFIPTIEKAIGRTLPDLSKDTALTELLALFKDLEISAAPDANLPRLLDILAGKYLEPLCVQPTFITHHPEALSPLAKSFIDEETGQRVAARAELFINTREFINTYEEENSPFEQRRKFEQQLSFQTEGSGTVDESYVEALEWGMPPTGGWGCGMDRLVMLLSGKKRIADVLPFGTLRNVVSMSKTRADQ